MTAERSEVIPFRKRGRPSAADDLRMELDSRRLEERRMDVDSAPLLRRLEFMAQVIGPEAWHTVAALSALHTRHARRWSRDEPERAA